MTAGASLQVADADEVDGVDLLRVAHEAGGVDIDAASRAAGDFLAALGIDVDSDDLRETPAGWRGPTPSCSARIRCG